MAIGNLSPVFQTLKLDFHRPDSSRYSYSGVLSYLIIIHKDYWCENQCSFISSSVCQQHRHIELQLCEYCCWKSGYTLWIKPTTNMSMKIQNAVGHPHFDDEVWIQLSTLQSKQLISFKLQNGSSISFLRQWNVSFSCKMRHMMKLMPLQGNLTWSLALSFEFGSLRT